MANHQKEQRTVILAATLPKAGSHFLMEILQQTFGSSFTWETTWGWPADRTLALIDQLLEYNPQGRFYGSRPDPRHHTVACPFHGGFHPNISKHVASNPNVKGLFIYRDPRDVLVSSVYASIEGLWDHALAVKIKNLKVSKEEKFDLYLQGYDGEPNMPGPLSRAYVSRRGFYDSPHFFNIRYEDLVGMSRGGAAYTSGKLMDGLAEFLDICTLDVAHGILNAIGRPTWMFRKGTAGQWRSELTAKNKQTCKQILGQTLIDWGYEKDMDWT